MKAEIVSCRWFDEIERTNEILCFRSNSRNT